MTQKKPASKRQKQEWPVVIYIWVIGLFFFAYLVSRMILDAYPHQFHWLALPIGLSGALIGIPLGWLWYRWRGDVI
jgi:ABC-type branched-subunit amino acid transport system permease subunit